MKIYTRGGDTGETGTLGPDRIAKDDIRIEALGAVDELNASLGCVLACNIAPDLAQILSRVQSELFVLGAELSRTADTAPEQFVEVTGKQVEQLESEIDHLTSQLDPLCNFILPGGDHCASMLHMARTICRRAERVTVAMARATDFNRLVIGYLNRLGDLLFVMARAQNKYAGKRDMIWTADS